MSQNQLHLPRISRRPSNWTKSFNEAQKCDPEQAQLREDPLNKLWQEHQGVLKVEAMITSSLEGVKQTETEGAVVFYEDEELAFTEVNELLSHLTAEQRKRLAKIIKKVVEPEAADLATRTGGMKMHEKFPPKISEVPKWVKLKKTTPMRKETDKKQNNRKKRIDKVIGRGKKREKETTPEEDATMVSMGTDGAIGGLKSDDEGESSQTEKETDQTGKPPNNKLGSVNKSASSSFSVPLRTSDNKKSLGPYPHKPSKTQDANGSMFPNLVNRNGGLSSTSSDQNGGFEETNNRQSNPGGFGSSHSKSGKRIPGTHTAPWLRLTETEFFALESRERELYGIMRPDWRPNYELQDQELAILGRGRENMEAAKKRAEAGSGTFVDEEAILQAEEDSEDINSDVEMFDAGIDYPVTMASGFGDELEEFHVGNGKEKMVHQGGEGRKKVKKSNKENGLPPCGTPKKNKISQSMLLRPGGDQGKMPEAKKVQVQQKYNDKVPQIPPYVRRNPKSSGKMSSYTSPYAASSQFMPYASSSQVDNPEAPEKSEKAKVKERQQDPPVTATGTSALFPKNPKATNPPEKDAKHPKSFAGRPRKHKPLPGEIPPWYSQSGFTDGPMLDAHAKTDHRFYADQSQFQIRTADPTNLPYNGLPPRVYTGLPPPPMGRFYDSQLQSFVPLSPYPPTAAGGPPSSMTPALPSPATDPTPAPSFPTAYLQGTLYPPHRQPPQDPSGYPSARPEVIPYPTPPHILAALETASRAFHSPYTSQHEWIQRKGPGTEKDAYCGTYVPIDILKYRDLTALLTAAGESTDGELEELRERYREYVKRQS
ncbi:MAG: hypothetical protein MMC33_008421 [Icmadophila ericetorum]|nr:hypothetical protein [Icmadophila ericetorum]